VLLIVLNIISVERNKQKVSAGLGKGENEQIRKCLIFDQLYARENLEFGMRDIGELIFFSTIIMTTIVRAGCS
jgi:hypothetical protein